jgi:translocation and assembly module TamA
MRGRIAHRGAALLPLCLLGALLALRPAHADVEIDIHGVNEELRNNVIAYLSLARYKDRELDPAVAERLRNRIDREVQDALRPFGYYEPSVRAEVAPSPRRKNLWRAVIDIEPGQPILMDQVDVRVVGPGVGDRLFQRILEQLPLHPGDRLRHASYERIKDDLQRTAATYGYLDARMTRSELKVDPPQHRASMVLELETGERYHFGATTIEQDVVENALVHRYMRYHEGDPFDLTQLLATQFALDDSQYFATVEVLPGEPDRELHMVPISIHAQRNRRDRYSFSGGYGTDTGIRGTLQWDRRWVDTHGDRFSAQIEASAVLQLAQVIYSIPIGDPAVEKLGFGITADSGTPGDLHNKDFAIGPSLTRVVGRWQYVFAVTPTYAVTDDVNGHQSQTLLIPSITLATVPRGYLGEALFQQEFIAQLRGGSSLFGTSDKFLQFHMQAERSFRLATNWHLLLRGEFGASLVSNVNDLPGALRFFAGGDGSVRGFEYDELSPVTPELYPNGTPVRDSNNNLIYLKTGGRDVLTGTVELERDLPRNLGIAVFSDFGNAFDSFGHSPNPVYPHFIEYSTGVGLRWRLPVVTVGIDVAKALSRSGTSPRLDINFSPKL